AECTLRSTKRLALQTRLSASGRQLTDVDEMAVEPLLIWVLSRNLRLDLVVVDDPALRGVDEKDAARPQPSALDDTPGGGLEGAGCRGEPDEGVVRARGAQGPQAVAIEHGADHGAVGEGDGRRTVPRLHQRRVEFVERPARRVHLRMVLPRLGNH